MGRSVGTRAAQGTHTEMVYVTSCKSRIFVPSFLVSRARDHQVMSERRMEGEGLTTIFYTPARKETRTFSLAVPTVLFVQPLF